MVLFQKLAQKYREVFPEFFKSCPNLLPTSYAYSFSENTSYLQLSGSNNWFYVVITIFAQHFNICSAKLVE